MIKFALLAGLILVAFLGYLIFDSSEIRIRRHCIVAPAFAEILAGKKIVHLSDTHFDRNSGEAAHRVLEIIKEIKPDMILLTGDYVKWYGRTQDYQRAFDFLRQLQAPLGVYAVMGDADYSFSRQSCMFCHREGSVEPPDLHRVTFIRDNYLDLPIQGRTLRLAGIDCWPPLKPDLSLTDSLIAEGHPTILLCHTSLVYARIPPEKNVVVLCGDTHGGQVYLPALFWKITKRKADPDHLRGFFQAGNKMLFVTSGIGTTDVPLRLGIPPEIVVFEFGEQE